MAGYGAGQQALVQYLNAMQEQKLRQQAVQQGQQQAQAQTLIPGAMQALFAKGGMPQQIQNPGLIAPQGPGMPGGGVSPSAGINMPPTGGAPGGVGPTAPSGAGASPPVFSPPAAGGSPNMADLWAYLQKSGAPAGAQAVAGQDIYKMMLPEQRLNDAMMRTQMQQGGASQRAQLGAETRLKIASETAAARRTAMAAAPKLKDDLQFRTLEDEMKATQSMYNANPSEDNLLAFNSAAKALADYSRSAQTKAASSPAARAGGGGEQPAGGGTVSVVAPDGTAGTIPAEQLNDALAQGYKKAP